MGIVFSIIFGLLALAFLWYWIKSLIIMANRSVLLAIAGFIFAPLAQIIYYFAEKNNLNTNEKTVLTRLMITWVASMVLGIITAMLLPSMMKDSAMTQNPAAVTNQ